MTSVKKRQIGSGRERGVGKLLVSLVRPLPVVFGQAKTGHFLSLAVHEGVQLKTHEMACIM